MSNALPPPLPPSTVATAKRHSWKRAAALGLVLPCGLFLVALVGLRLLGLLQAFSIPTESMNPAVNRGDQIYVEGVTYLFSSPKRGDMVVFKTDEIPEVSPHQLYVKRLVGLPGDRLHLSKGTIYVNDQPTVFRNRMGPVYYADWSHARHLADDFDTYTVPKGQYFVIGDNATNSVDSRLLGGIPQQAVTGRAFFCYFPATHFGAIR